MRIRHATLLTLPVLVAALFATGCAPKYAFVLLPDPDGKVGQLTVSGEHGSQTLSSARESTRIRSAGQLPTTPYTMRRRAVDGTFGSALKAQPEQPAKFTLHFVTGQTRLTPTSQRVLLDVVREIGTRQAVDISVTGHTDRAGNREFNRRLAAKRAADVARLLAAQGVDRRILTVVSHGEAFPLIPTADGVSEPRNRRVEITVR
jgi:outer membrane protein OmpA-like peptidoglycan-associated protein